MTNSMCAVSEDKTTGLDVAVDVNTRIGANTNGSEFFNGTIDEVRLYDRAVTVTEIQDLMTVP